MADRAAGLALVEDLGDGLFARLIDADPALETPLYEAATDLVAELARHKPPAFIQPFLPESRPLAFDFYAPGAGRSLPETAGADYVDAMKELLAGRPATPPAMLLRDYHAENLIWLPDARASPGSGFWTFRTR